MSRDTTSTEDRRPFQFSLLTLLAVVALAAVSLATITNHEGILLLGVTTFVLLAAALVTFLRRDHAGREIVAAMVVYYAVSRWATRVVYMFGYVPHLGLPVGLGATVLFLLCIRFRPPSRHLVAASLIGCFLALGALLGLKVRSIAKLVSSEPESVARDELLRVYGHEASRMLTLVKVERKKMPSAYRGPIIVYEVRDGDVAIGWVHVHAWWFWWMLGASDVGGARELLDFARRRLDSDPRTAERIARRVLREYRHDYYFELQATRLLDKLGKSHGEGTGTDNQATSEVRRPSGQEAERTSEVPLPAVDFSETEEEAIAEIKRLGGRVGVSAKGPEELPGTDITWVDWSRTKITDRHFALLRAIPHLQMVDLSETAVGDDHLAHLRGLDQLQQLNVSRTNVTGSGLEHLKGSKLRSLGIGNGRLSELRLHHIAGFTELEDLQLEGPVTDECLKHLVGLDRLIGLGVTDAYPHGVKATDAGLAHLAGLVQLQDLWLDCFEATDAGVAHLKRLTNLESLSIDAVITDAGMAHLAGMRKLGFLSIKGESITDAGLEHLKGLTELEDLWLYTSQDTEVGLAHLAGLKNLTGLIFSGPRIRSGELAHVRGLVQLETLRVSGSAVTDGDLAHLAPLAKLKQLSLDGTAVSDAGLAHLKRLPQLEQVDLSGTRVTAAGADALRKALPNAQISYEPNPSN